MKLNTKKHVKDIKTPKEILGTGQTNTLLKSPNLSETITKIETLLTKDPVNGIIQKVLDFKIDCGFGDLKKIEISCIDKNFNMLDNLLYSSLEYDSRTLTDLEKRDKKIVLECKEILKTSLLKYKPLVLSIISKRDD